MKPILLIAIVAVAAVALSTGYLSNEVDLWTQEFGVGEQDIESPVTNAALTLIIERSFIFTLIGNTLVTDSFNDFITDCVYRSTNVDHLPGTKIFCKLLNDENISSGKVIAEGITNLGSTVLAGTPITIPIDMIIQNDVDFIHDAVILVQNPPS